MKRGEIWLANVQPRSGSEQQGIRPVLIISTDALNAIPNWKSMIVVPLSTSAKQSQRGPTTALLEEGEANLIKPCNVLCHQITTLDRSKFKSYIGILAPKKMAEVKQALLNSLDL